MEQPSCEVCFVTCIFFVCVTKNLLIQVCFLGHSLSTNSTDKKKQLIIIIELIRATLSLSKKPKKRLLVLIRRNKFRSLIVFCSQFLSFRDYICLLLKIKPLISLQRFNCIGGIFWCCSREHFTLGKSLKNISTNNWKNQLFYHNSPLFCDVLQVSKVWSLFNVLTLNLSTR